jgi:hypothetical protein
MPNRDGLDTRHDLNRQVGYNRWVGDDTKRYATSVEREGPGLHTGEISVEKTPYGYEAGHTRSEYSSGPSRRSAFEDATNYAAGPFKTEHRAEVAARAMTSRPESKLANYHAGSKRTEFGPDD